MASPIRKVVFPVAGLGTRFLPATRAVPKEMIPVVDKPLIQYAVEEAAKAGITDMVFVTAAGKEAIMNHFDYSYELWNELQSKGKKELLDVVSSICPPGVHLIFTRQYSPKGLGDAVLCAKPVIGDSPFAVILPDDLVDSPSSCIGELIAKREEKGGGNVVAVQNVPREKTNLYGIASVKADAPESVTGLVEKPKPEEAPSTLAVIGRYVFEPSIFDYLENVTPGAGGEIQLTDAMEASLESVPMTACRFSGRRFDCGSKQGFITATVHYAKKAGFDTSGDAE